MRWVSAAAAAGLGRWGLPVKNGEAGRLLLPECPGLLVGPDRNEGQYQLIPYYSHDFASGPAVETQLS